MWQILGIVCTVVSEIQLFGDGYRLFPWFRADADIIAVDGVIDVCVADDEDEVISARVLTLTAPRGGGCFENWL